MSPPYPPDDADVPAASPRTDNTALLASLPDLDIEAAVIVVAVDEGRAAEEDVS